MLVTAAARLLVGTVLGFLVAHAALAERAWYDDRPGSGCCGPGWDGYGSYPRRPQYPPPITAPPFATPYMPPPRAWGPPVVVVPVQPPVTYSRPPAEFVYWCDDPKGYYPNVTNCNGPWREQSATMPR